MYLRFTPFSSIVLDLRHIVNEKAFQLSPLPVAGNISAFYIHQNNIRPNLLDFIKTDHDLRLTPHETEYFITSRHHDLPDTAGAMVKFQITHPPQLLAVPDIDNILAPKLRKSHTSPARDSLY